MPCSVPTPGRRTVSAPRRLTRPAFCTLIMYWSMRDVADPSVSDEMAMSESSVRVGEGAIKVRRSMYWSSSAWVSSCASSRRSTTAGVPAARSTRFNVFVAGSIVSGDLAFEQAE